MSYRNVLTQKLSCKTKESLAIVLTCHNIFIVTIFRAFAARHTAGIWYDLRPTRRKKKKVLQRNFFYSRRKLRKKLEALRKKQFSSSGV